MKDIKKYFRNKSQNCFNISNIRRSLTKRKEVYRGEEAIEQFMKLHDEIIYESSYIDGFH